MSQRDLVAELRTARPTAPVEVRERVRLIAAAAAAERRRFTWRRALVVGVPALAAVAAAAVLLPSHGAKREQPFALETIPQRSIAHGAAANGAAKLAPAPAASRVQQVGTELSLRAASADDVSFGVKRAQTIVGSLGGYVISVHATSHGQAAAADLVLKVPRVHVQTALARLSQLGTITAEQLDVQDETATVNATKREIARLQRTLRTLRAQPQTDAVERQIAAVTARVEALQRANASTLRTAHFATVSLHFATAAPVHHAAPTGPFHWLGRAFVWLGVGLVYVLALGAPVAVAALLVWLAVRTLRRRREDALLSRP